MLAIFFIAHAYYGFARAGFHEGVVRTDDNSQYFPYQDIINAFNMSKPSWFYGHNFGASNGRTEHIKRLLQVMTTCTYFKKDSLSKTHVNFTKHYEEKGKKEWKHLYGTFFTTHGIGSNGAPTTRDTANGVGVSSTPDGKPDSLFKLVYSNYENCSILRPILFEQLPQDFPGPGNLAKWAEELEGNSYYSHTKGLCVVLLGDDAARSGGLPPWCNATYKNMCGTGTSFTVVFNLNCSRIPNVLGC